MSDFNQQHNRVVWFDIPAADLERARGFYRAVLNIEVHKESMEGFEFCVFDHKDGNGGCVITDPDAIAREGGVMIYLNVQGRIRDAVKKVETKGGKIVEPIHPIGPYGFRAIVRDSEGNRVALHSQTDA